MHTLLVPGPDEEEFMSLFTEERVPDLLMPDLLTEHETTFDYHLAEGDARSGLTGMLLEGVEGEPVSPGRYARIWMDIRQLPREPRSADWIVVDDETYDVEYVAATLYDIWQLTIKLTGQQWQSR